MLSSRRCRYFGSALAVFAALSQAVHKRPRRRLPRLWMSLDNVHNVIK